VPKLRFPTNILLEMTDSVLLYVLIWHVLGFESKREAVTRI